MEEKDPKQEDVAAGESEGAPLPKLEEAIEKSDGFQSDAPGGGTHEEEVGRPAWGEGDDNAPGEQGKQLQSGGMPPGA